MRAAKLTKDRSPSCDLQISFKTSAYADPRGGVKPDEAHPRGRRPGCQSSRHAGRRFYSQTHAPAITRTLGAWRLTCARSQSYPSPLLLFPCRVSQRTPSTSAAHGVRITAVVQAARIAASTRSSNARLQSPAMAGSACAINGTTAMERTRAGVSVRLTCVCSSRLPSRFLSSRSAQCLQARKAHLGVSINQMEALIAASIRGNNAGRTLQSMPIAPAILGTAAQRTRAGVSEIKIFPSPSRPARSPKTIPSRL
jgi:hypothetical protein